MFADFSWAITERLTLAVGARQQEDTNFGTAQVRGTNFTEFSAWDDNQVDYRNPFGYTAVSTRLPQAVFEDTTARVSLQYQWTDDLMTYVTVSNGYAPGGVSQVPTNILVLDATGVATGDAVAARSLQRRIRRSSICRTAWSAARRPSTTTRSA